jgi:2,4-dienoyl-CoA reductase-like NADH-dependent reductase (Old Yellow Enzyme family)
MGANSTPRRVRLFETLELGKVTLPNRIMLSPMCQYCAPDSIPGQWHKIHLVSRAVGGVGLVMTEATAVEPAGRITPYCLGLWNDDQETAFADIAAAITDAGSVAAIQLAHAGRKASVARPWEGRVSLTPDQGGWQVVGPATVPWESDEVVPRALSGQDIAELVNNFRSSAARAYRAGFRIMEIHAAHGYLLHSFLSPLTNRRMDGYGGGFEGRCRFLLEVVEAIRRVWPDQLPLFVRLSATDWLEGGWTIEDTVRLAGILAALGVDAIDCSSGGIINNNPIKPYPGYQVPLAERVRSEAQIPTVTVGMISQPAMAEEIVANGRADLIALGRLLLWDPYWPHHAAKHLRAEMNMPIQYARCDIFN